MDTGVWRATVYRVAKSWIHLSSYTVFLFFLSCFLSFYHLHHPLSGLSHQHLLSWGWWWFSRSVVPDSYSPMDCSPPGSSVHGISQVRILEWLAISFSRGSSQPRNQNSCLLRKAFLSLLAILWSSAFKWVYLSFSPLLFTSLLFTAICKASPDSHFAFLSFSFLGMVLIPVSCTMSRTSVCSSSGTLSDLVP